MVQIAAVESNEKENKILLQAYDAVKHEARVQSFDLDELMCAFNVWLKIPADKFQSIKEAMCLMDYSELMMNNLHNRPLWMKTVNVVEDDSAFPTFLNATNFVGCLSLDVTAKLAPDAIRLQLDQYIQFCKCVDAEIHWMENLECPSEDEYKTMCTKKRGGRYLMIFQIMQMYSDQQINFEKIAEILGQLGRIYEDYVSVQAENDAISETPSNEGNFSFPIVHAVQKQPHSAAKIMNLLGKKAEEKSLRKYFVTLLEQSGSLEYTKKLLVELQNGVIEELKKLPENKRMNSLLKKLNFD